MAFQQALSGLRVSSNAIDATSNNIANAATVGYKNQAAHFGDMFAAALNGSGASQIGIGANLLAVQQQFTQGNITTTNNPLDIAINGGGFFRMSNNGAITYSRNGQFHLDKDGFIVDDLDRNLTGYGTVNGIISQSIAPLQVSAAFLSPQATGQNPSAAYNGVRVGINLDSRADVPVSPWVNGGAPGDTTSYTPDPTTYNWRTSLDVYDSLGNPHNLAFYFVKTATPGEWEVYTSVDGTTNQNSGGPGPLGTLTFDNMGRLTGGSPMAASIDLDNLMVSQGQVNSALSPLAFNIDFAETTQFGTNSGLNKFGLQQDGYAPGSFTGITVSPDGVVQVSYSNGQTVPTGQVILADFANPNGLRAIGNNQWVETSESGPPMLDIAGTSGRGALQAMAVEESNTDLTQELVNLITFQRNYQANAQSIRTQDAIMQTIVSLR
ncbi:MAG: flagellar hook protein FlgE [Azonexus sp.]|jgi:flagellar hook protein FlgE|nr:flagellar hook protein FlgE [Azonexus sp.]